jgi:hypothetical protein
LMVRNPRRGMAGEEARCWDKAIRLFLVVYLP